MFNPNDLDIEFQFKIPKNHSGACPGNWVFFDVETHEGKKDKFKHLYFRLAWTRAFRVDKDLTLSRDQWKYWENATELWQYITSRCRSKSVLHVCAHNIQFDIQASGAFKLLDDWGWTLKFDYEKGTSFILSITKDDLKIMLISSTNYFAFKLAELGDLIRLPKMEIDFDTSSPESVKQYCRRDVEILSTSLINYMQFVKENDCGKFALTRASQALNWYRHRFMNKAIFIHDCEMVKELERECYFGGRTEAFYIGKVPYSGITFLDFNSMYPSVMKTKPYPTKLIGYLEEGAIDEFLKRRGRCCFSAEVEIETDQAAYAKRSGGKNVFPVGSFTTFLCTEGLEYAYDHGHLKSIKRLAVYSKQYIFADWVDEMYSLRKKYKAEGNKIYERMIKIMMNSLYGKFGMRISDDEYVDNEGGERFSTEIIVNTYDHTITTERVMFGMRKVIGEMKDGDKTFTSIAAHVTEYSRFALWDCLSFAGPKRVFYCDTDSLAIKSDDCKRFDHLISDQQLGALGIDKVCTILEIHGLKDYSLDGIRKTKGVPKNAIQTGPDTFEYDSFLKTASHQFYKTDDHFLLRPTVKVLSNAYTKGKVGPDGYVTPLHFSNDVLLN